MRVGADRLKIAVLGDQAVGCPDKAFAQPFGHRLHTPILPKEGMPAARAEIRDAQAINLTQTFNLFPKLGHRAGVQHLKFKPPHFVQHGTAPHLHQHSQRRYFPQHDLGPVAFERQFILIANAFQVIRGQTQVFEPVHEIRAEHLAFAVERVAAHPRAFAARQAKGANVIQLFAQLAFVDQLGQWHMRRPVDQAESNLRVGFVAKHRLAHQKFVEIRVDQGPHNRVDLPLMVPDAGGDIDQLTSPIDRPVRLGSGAILNGYTGLGPTIQSGL